VSSLRLLGDLQLALWRVVDQGAVRSSFLLDGLVERFARNDLVERLRLSGDVTFDADAGCIELGRNTLEVAVLDLAHWGG